VLRTNASPQAGALSGTWLDATPFGEYSPAKMEAILALGGLHKSGHEAVRCGMTGELKEVLYYTGIISYQRLVHMVADKRHARALGPHDPLTRQPIAGRSRDGGGRLGEMEGWAISAHGCAQFLHERFVESSDGTPVAICDSCGTLSRRNTPPYICARKSCTNERFFTTKKVPRIFIVLQSELLGSNIYFTLYLLLLLFLDRYAHHHPRGLSFHPLDVIPQSLDFQIQVDVPLQQGHLVHACG